MQWLKLPAWKVGDRGFAPHSGLQLLKKQNVSSPLTRNQVMIQLLWGTSVTDRWCAWTQTARAPISNSVSGGQCHLIILSRFSWPSLAYMCTKVA